MLPSNMQLMCDGPSTPNVKPTFSALCEWVSQTITFVVSLHEHDVAIAWDSIIVNHAQAHSYNNC